VLGGTMLRGTALGITALGITALGLAGLRRTRRGIAGLVLAGRAGRPCYSAAGTAQQASACAAVLCGGSATRRTR
jgi:hypothetical protein